MTGTGVVSYYDAFRPKGESLEGWAAKIQSILTPWQQKLLDSLKGMHNPCGEIFLEEFASEDGYRSWEPWQHLVDRLGEDAFSLLGWECTREKWYIREATLTKIGADDMSQSLIEPEGSIALWTLPDHLQGERLELLSQVVKDAGLDLPMPKPRSPEQAAARALKLACSEASNREQAYLARSCEPAGSQEAAWVVVKERKHLDGNSYTVQANAWLEPTKAEDGSPLPGTLGVARHASLPEGFKEMLERLFEDAKKSICATSMGSWLCKAAAALQGRSLRAGGGVYWIPGAKMPLWDAIAEAVEQAYSMKARVYRIKHKVDAQTATKIVETVREDVNATVDALEKEVFGTQDLSKRRAASINATLDGLLDTLKSYEACLSQGLEDVKERVRKARASRATGELLAAIG